MKWVYTYISNNAEVYPGHRVFFFQAGVPPIDACSRCGRGFPQLLHLGACPIKLRTWCATQIPANHLSWLTIHIGNASGPSLPVLAPYRAIAQFVIAIAAH